MSHLPEMGEGAPERVFKPKKLLATILATFALAAGFPAQAQELDLADYREALTKPIVPDAEFLQAMIELNETRIREIRENTIQNIEEMTVTAVDLSQVLNPDIEVYNLHVGLEGKVLVHVYDELSNSWKYVGSNPFYKQTVKLGPKGVHKPGLPILSHYKYICMSDNLEKINNTVLSLNTQQQFDAWLFELGKNETAVNIRQKPNFVRGCEVDVWITTGADGDLIFDTDSQFVRGLCVLLQQVLNTAEDPQAVMFSDFANVTKYIPLVRKRGFQKLLNKAQSLLTSTQDVL